MSGRPLEIDRSGAEGQAIAKDRSTTIGGAHVGESDGSPLLQARGLHKSYGSVQALRGASFDLAAGEVVALIGDNGAGKSTLVKCLSGVERPDAGEILIDGTPVGLDSPTAARRYGIETAYQDLAVAPDLDPAANLFLGRELRRPGLLGVLGMLDKAAMRRQAAEQFGRLGVTLQDLDVPIGALSGGQRQSVAVARSVVWASRVVFLDEPTAALGVVQRERVLDVIRRVRDTGVAVVLISHNMPEVLAVADRIEVLRLGTRVARFSAADATLEQLVGAMTGALAHEEDR
jgi:simple sugar transport system ATP-binding protein